MELHEALAARVDAWRESCYPGDVPALAEILDFAIENVESGAPWPHSGYPGFRAPAVLED